MKIKIEIDIPPEEVKEIMTPEAGSLIMFKVPLPRQTIAKY